MTANPGSDSEALLRKMHKALSLPFSTRDFEQTVADLKAGHLQAFWNDTAIILTEICVSPRRTFLNIFLAAGDLKGLYELQPQVVMFAKNNGLTQAQAMTRPGWARILKTRGWKKVGEIWHFPLEEWDQ